MQGSGWIPARDDSIRLPDGRTLAYAEWGDLGGRPVFYFHGMPGSRLFIPDPDAAADEHVRVIAAARPGMVDPTRNRATSSPTGRQTSTRSPTHSASSGSA